MDLGLGGKRCLVTGSTGGIGLDVVRQLVGEGALPCPADDGARPVSARSRTSWPTWLALVSPSEPWAMRRLRSAGSTCS